MKRVLSAVTKLYALFAHSPLRLSILRNTLEAVDGMSHKLVQPGDTRWLSHEGSISVVLKHYIGICMALEAIYVEAGDLSSDAGGLLLTLRKASTLQFLVVLQHFLQPLAGLSKTLQSSGLNIATAMSVARATTASLRDDFDVKKIEQQTEDIKNAASQASVRLEQDDISKERTRAICIKYQKVVVSNLEQRFSDEVSNLSEVQSILSEKAETADFTKVARILGLSSSDLDNEWRILRRLPDDLSTQESLITLAVSPDRAAMFPAFSAAARKLLLLPIGTATVERSFSTMNRILCSQRCRLLPEHTCQLMQMAIEGPPVPDVRDASDCQRSNFDKVLDTAYDLWLKQPRRGL